MKTHLRILLALLIKNNSHGSVYLAPLFLGLMALFAAWESPRPESDGLFIFGLLWLMLLATASGTGAFSLDLKNDTIRFLEYLPIRRWHILAANFADGLFWLGLFVLATSWARMVYWSPPPGPLSEIDPAGQFLFHSRWSYPIGLFGLAFFAFSVAAYERLAVERDSTAVLRSYSSVIFGILLLVVLTAVNGVRPRIDEAAIPLVLIGVINLLCAAVFFQFTRREWGRLRRWFQLRLPTMTVQIAASVAIVLIACSNWSKLDPHEATRLNVSAVPGSDPHRLLLYIDARRSGSHLMLLELAGGTPRYLGRGLGYFRTNSNSVTLTSPAPGFLPLTSGFVRLDSTGNIDWPGFIPEKLKEGDVPYVRSTVVWSQDGEHVAYLARAGTSDSESLVITDRGGESRYTARCMPYGSILDLRPGVILVTLANPTESYQDPQPHENYVICDLEQNTQTEYRLPGDLLFCDPDFTRVLCLQTRRQGDQPVERSVVLHHLATGKTQTVLTPQDLTSGEPGSDDQSRWNPRRPMLAGEEGGASVGPLEVHIDRAMTQVIWQLARNVDRPESGVNWIQIEPGRRRQIVAADEARRLRTTPNVLNLMRFTSDGKNFIMRTTKNLLCISIDDGTRAILAHWDKPNEANFYVRCMLSPNGHRVLDSQSEWNPDRSTAVQSWNLWERGLPTLLSKTASAELSWLDDERILIVEGSSLYLLELITGTRTLLYRAN